ncbi:Vitamin B12-binding protein precursor [Pelotomaculum sp. FP]|uniref:ABC transporter substrate-binding protein n=1 Tax=Pelotomaculum sp. FP TaxID=261474 RepID=UPI001064CF44|nr:ABC transporter substrate-binding protein [Pelotomaculum sp. FP]TEB17400.1 Vitamin B12-binding protein precursor [Pelotomaculum sp. FP]
MFLHRRKLIILFIFLLLFGMLAGCGSSKTTEESGGIVVVDDLGKEIRLKETARRIVSLYPAHTENLFALGLSEEIVGVSGNETYPPEALTKPGFSFRGDTERVIAARPDLVLSRPFISNANPDFITKLEAAGIPVVTLYPENIEQFFTYLQKLGKLTGKEKEAGDLVDGFNKRLQEIEEAVEQISPEERKRVFFETNQDDLKTCTSDSNAAFVLERAGAVNIAADARAVREGSTIAAYGQERLLTRSNDIDVYIVQNGEMNRVREQDVYNRPGYRIIKAVRERQVYVLDEEIMSRPTMRLLDGIVEVGSILYPHVFEQLGNGQ